MRSPHQSRFQRPATRQDVTTGPRRELALGSAVLDARNSFDAKSDRISIDELVKGVNIALGNMPLDRCLRFDANGNGRVTIDELIKAVNAALNGCVEPLARLGAARIIR